MNTPTTIEEITPQWLTLALTEGQVIKHAHVVDAKTRILGAGIGFLSKVVHCSLEYDQAEPSAPASVVVKIELGSGELRQLSDEVQAFRREILFYRDVAPHAPIRMPSCYFVATGAPNSALVMEDLSFASPCDQVGGMHATKVIETASLIGRLHAAYWDNDRLAALDWMPTSNRQFWTSLNERWDSFIANFEGTLGDSAKDLGQRIARQIRWVEKEVERRPRTLVHSDLKADNILFGPDGTPDSILILDWQLAVRSMGAFDIARLIGGSELPAERHGHQLDVLRAWFNALIEGGVTYQWDEAIYDLRLGGLQMVGWAVNFHASVADVGGRPKDLVTRICERAIESAVEMDAGSIMPLE